MSHALPHTEIDVLVDCDTGLDDALALMLLFRVPGVRVHAVTCVNGNVGVDHVTRNTLSVLDVIGAPDVPVARGCPQPLASERVDASWIHGEAGLGTVVLPESDRKLVPQHAVELMRSTLMEAESPLTLIALGPLTNLAVLFTAHPEVKDKIERLIVMGGSAAAGGNDDAAAEFNFFADPEAADIVLRAGIETVMYGLDVFNRLALSKDDVAQLAASTDPAAQLASKLLVGYNLLGDAGAVATALWPDGAETAKHPTVVELAGKYTRGMSLVDRRPADRRGPHEDRTRPEINITWEVDQPLYVSRFLAAVTSQG